ncbi:hypothetical protein [Hallerella succinigenes]|uniref:hypothetical protein n=1 Tax=Hallerella succinigenes TaxID=1896222 RepID=UPI0012FE51E7|nr:hypothetical protein [Hallerella succinigenes]
MLAFQMVVSTVDKSLFEKLANSSKKSKCPSLNTASEAEDITITLELKGTSLLLENTALELEGSSLLLENTALELEGTSLLLENTALELKGTSLLLENTTLELKGTSLLLENTTLELKGTSLLLENTALELEGSSLLLEDEALPKEEKCWMIQWWPISSQSDWIMDFTKDCLETSTSRNENSIKPWP